jgi:hypothetical protein
MKMEIRTYLQTDKDDILNTLASNTPKYFGEEDKNDLLNFLENHADKNFKVVILDDKVVGCGGHYIKQIEKNYGIAWVMFKRFSMGVSTFLSVSDTFFNYLLTAIQQEKFEYDILINTTQLLEKTFHKYGFETEQVIKNGFGENLDHYQMRRKWQNS